MRVLNINDFDLLNRRFNGYDLSVPLKAMGVESRFLVWTKQSDDPAVRQLCGGYPSKALRHATRSFERCVGFQNLLYPFSVRMFMDRWYRDADIVHMHLIHNDFFSMLSIPRMAEDKKVVWTVHDPWLITGHCIYPLDCQRWKDGCGDCPRLDSPKPIYVDNTGAMCDIKRRIVQRSDVHLVVASEWMKGLLSSSPVTKGKDVTVIPLGIDLKRFRSKGKEAARRALGVREGSTVVTFRSTSNPFKGAGQVIGALRSMKAAGGVTVLTFNQKGLMDDIKDRYSVIELGWASEEEMSLIYGATDIFVMPSVAEAFGMLAIEFMASGAPVIACRGTALEEIIDDGRTGLLVDQGDAEGLKGAIERLVQDPLSRKGLGENALEAARRLYGIEVQAERTAALYSGLMSEK
jgi:glycosyltransferase involved in cell wall biosynthesis